MELFSPKNISLYKLFPYDTNSFHPFYDEEDDDSDDEAWPFDMEKKTSYLDSFKLLWFILL